MFAQSVNVYICLYNYIKVDNQNFMISIAIQKGSASCICVCAHITYTLFGCVPCTCMCMHMLDVFEICVMFCVD